MSEQTSRDEAVRAANLGVNAKRGHFLHPSDLQIAFDAARKAGLISYQDEWVEIAKQIDIDEANLHVHQPAFVRRVSFEAGEEKNEEQGR